MWVDVPNRRTCQRDAIREVHYKKPYEDNLALDTQYDIIIIKYENNKTVNKFVNIIIWVSHETKDTFRS